ncbi:fibronectin type III domain-containing protein [Flavobacterium sp.]
MKKNYLINTLTDFSHSANKILPSAVLFFLTLLGVSKGVAQVNNCGANALTVGTSCTTPTNYNVTSGFTNDGPAPCSGTSFRDGWYSFTTDATTTSITIQGTSNRELGLAVYSGACGSLTQIACTVPGAANANLNNVTVNPSTTYMLRLMRTNNGSANNMTGTICVYKSENTVPATGNNSYSMCSGNLYDSGGSAGNYTASSDGYTVINPATPGNLVRVSGSITAEGGYDYLTIYDGTGTGGTILYGGAAHGTGTTCSTFTVPTITSSTGPLTVRFYSDISNNCAGFNLTVSCVALSPCTTPTAQPTALTLSSITGNSTNGSFTAASPAPSGYLVVRSTSATPPTLTNGTSYAVGFTGLTPGTTYVIQGSASVSNAVSFSATGLTSNTNYYYHVFSYNSSCTGMPFYLTTAPLTNNAVTCAAPPTSAVNSAISLTSATVSWTASAAGGGAGAISYTLEVYTNAGYTGPIPGSPFSLGAGLTYNLTGLTSGTTYYYRIRANNGYCNSTYLTGTVSTAIPNNQCSTATALPCGTTNLAGTTVGAASFTHGSGCTMSNYGVWYTFVGDGNQNIIAATGSSYDLEMSISSGSCGALTNIACRDAVLGNGTETYTFNTVLGTTYYVYIAHWDAASTTTGNFTISRTCVAPLTNDECSGAIALTVTSTCNYVTYSNSGATTSTGMTVPGCANFQGADVWFSVVVPATGEINVDLQTGSMTDSGIALYSGTCGALTLLDCDDDSSANGLMSFLQRTGLTPGQTIYIRVWEFGADNNGTFGICVSTPSCPSPSDLNANILSSTSVTVNWTASSPPASGGYQYYYNTTGVAPTNATPPTGSTAPGVIGVTFTGLTPGLKYYFWVRSFCGGSDTSTWFGATNYTPCNVGSGTGNTSLACPSVLTGGVGMSGGNPLPLSCTALTCTNLEATFLEVSQPTNYTVTAITDPPPYQFTCLQNPVSVNIDDVWSQMINLPFNFCFYGNNYNRCLIGSNGVITFDTTTYAPGGYNDWQFTNNLPSTALIRNAIFGVYHDIDPSKGGQVGWELITLNTGCRALVASWNDIPMYSSACNSQLYTGMIVLYENTNVIEVYVKEKNVCATWNGGNAVVGLQNAAGTAAVVAPNRNSLDTDWTVGGAGEAWRFTPSGSSLTSVQWYQGSIAAGNEITGATQSTSGNITTSTINVCPSVTTTYFAQVTYQRCNGALTYADNAVVTVNGNKIWNGFTSSDWNTAANWTPSGVPTSANCVVIPVTANNPVIANTPDAVGYNLNVYNNAQLTINSNQNLTITDRVTVQPGGIFTINNSASLIQINNVLNSGNIIYRRTSPNIRTLDYVYWSSPVAGFNVNNIVSPYAFGAIYHWNTTVSNGNGGQGNWQNAAGSTMVAGKGYIARAPGTSPFNNATTNPLNGSFAGVPNNGNINIAIERGNDQNTLPHTGTNGTQITNLSDNWNLLGNPYPSAIRASQFLFDNNTKIEGNVRLWTHGTLPSIIEPSPFYGSYLSNYTPGDYLTYNFTGTSCCPTAASDLFIGAGQGFFVQMVDGPPVAAAANITVAFNNNLRSAAYSNNTFYKTQNFTTSSAIDVDNIERNRIWLDFINPNNQTDRILFGYIEGATMEKDSFFDCITQNTGASLVYSMVDDTKFFTQGRALPFDQNDEVTIGFNAPTQGNYTIGIAAVDGLFDVQNIYLKDNLLNVTHNLKSTPYHFTTISGEINNRFKIVYVDNALGVPTPTFDENSVKVMANNELAVSSSNLMMESITVFNVLGQKLDTYKNINAGYTILSNVRKNNATLLLNIKLQTGETVTKKIIF